SQTENMAMFLNDEQGPEAFTLVYEPSGKSTSIFGVEGEILFRVSEMINIGGNLNIRNIDVPTQEHAWYMPKVEIGANARFNISEKLYIDGELRFLGETYGRVMEEDNSIITPGLPQRIAVNKTMPSFVDLSAGASYKINNQFGLFGRVNNILNSKYERFGYYPALGMNIYGGLTFSF